MEGDPVNDATHGRSAGNGHRRGQGRTVVEAAGARSRCQVVEGLVPEVGIEPTRGEAPRDFEFDPASGLTFANVPHRLSFL